MILSTAMKLTKNLATIDALGCEIFGALHGMPREEKEQWLQQLAKDKLTGRLPPWAS
jgi:predicted transposase YbfD/YdcC